MAAAKDPPLALPMPTDERSLALAHHVLAQAFKVNSVNVNSESVDELAQRHGVAAGPWSVASATKPA
jgi:hypothetical protein